MLYETNKQSSRKKIKRDYPSEKNGTQRVSVRERENKDFHRACGGGCIIEICFFCSLVSGSFHRFIRKQTHKMNTRSSMIAEFRIMLLMSIIYFFFGKFVTITFQMFKSF